MTYPGPTQLGRGAVVDDLERIPPGHHAAPIIVIDEEVVADPGVTVQRLHHLWVRREPFVVHLKIDPASFRTARSVTTEPWRLGPDFEPALDRLHFLVWTNTYDARAAGEPIWWWGRKAARIDGHEIDQGQGDLTLDDGTSVWIDGGPRGPIGSGSVNGLALVSFESVERGSLSIDSIRQPADADLAADQLAAVVHRAGPARVIAPAGSGKTRVLTERLRHLIQDRGWSTDSVLAVAYNKQAQLELEARTKAFTPRVRTLNSLGLWILRKHRGSAPALLSEREVRRIVDDLLPGKRRHRANTDPIGPYLEALGSVRLGLTDPSRVERERDDIEGFAELFAPYQDHLARRGVVDFDEQIYGAIRVLLSDGAFRRSIQRECRHILVDEFQDLTPAHVLLIRLLALPGLDVFGVGDDDQVIYGHNCADPGFLIDYDRLFPGALSRPLTTNYRCPLPVIDAAKKLLGYNRRRVDKSIEAGPGATSSLDGLRVVEHGSDDTAKALVAEITTWLDAPGVTPDSIAVLCRVNSLLLAPQVALTSAGIAVDSVLNAEILQRTGLRAALAYLRLATSDGPMASSDIIEILRRPTRGLPRWFPDRLERSSSWSLDKLRTIADHVPDKEAVKVIRLVDDLALIGSAARGGTTRAVLEAVRDDVGLGSAMGLLDGSTVSGSQGSSHLDDLEGLLDVADLHPEPRGFEAWLRQLLQQPAAPDGVTLSTIHRVKGREWPRVVVFGVNAGLMPHRLSGDVEEERRILHVAITRGREQVVILTDRTRKSPFLAELDGTAPKRPQIQTKRPRLDASSSANDPRTRRPARSAPAKRSRQGVQGDIPVVTGMELVASGGHRGVICDADGRAAALRMANGKILRVRYGERVHIDGKSQTLCAPVELWGAARAAEELLRSWRTAQARASGKPAYTVLSDAHLRGIALTRPTTAAELAGCDGIGPTKLERWGDDLLAILDEVE